MFQILLFLVLELSAVSAINDIQTILHISDVHLNTTLEKAVYFKDSSIDLFSSALEFAKQQIIAPDLVLYTGDHAVHGRFTDKQLYPIVETNVKMIQNHFPNQSLLTWILGNSDSRRDYYMEITDPSVEINPQLQFLAPIWNATEKYQRTGFGEYQLLPKVYILALNTVPYSPSHTPKSNATDPFGQFKWMQQRLETYEAENASCLIVGHIPPIIDSYGGSTEWKSMYLQRYQDLMKEYAHVVTAQLFGHVHSLEMRVAESLPPLFTTGSISPLFGNNPTFSVWKYNATAGEMVNWIVYGSNLTETGVNWHQLYSSRLDFQLPSLSTAQLSRFVTDIQHNDSLFQLYYQHTKGNSMNQAPCANVTCKARIQCTLTWFPTSEEYESCVLTPEIPASVAALFLTVAVILVTFGGVFWSLKRYRKRQAYEALPK